MTIEHKSTVITNAEIRQIIAQAERLRAEYMVNRVRTGLSTLAGLFTRGQKRSVAS